MTSGLELTPDWLETQVVEMMRKFSDNSRGPEAIILTNEEFNELMQHVTFTHQPATMFNRLTGLRIEHLPTRTEVICRVGELRLQGVNAIYSDEPTEKR